ncbi:MFS transporter [Planotetraspora mira]|uniref:MFS transporter n=1 Tax=Planotetraspora mira TaxID=58121 RepID=A0A8J3X8I9_9ACTN|nr:MFS transporter [Planotetraspora mira]GII27543.1 MFS transporter [Planotetraspora mira]
MYLSTIGRQRTRTGDGQAGRRRWTAIGANVFALGTVSLVTDISSEMVTAILPVYLVVGLQFSPAAYGVIDGAYTGATVLLRLVGGYLADRVRRRKAVAGLGYGISAVAKLGLLAAGGSVTAIGLVIAADRAGKGLRTAPRDALITLSAPPDQLGRAFGVHRTMDSVGAFLGPLVALAVLALAGQQYDAVFVTSFCVAAFAVVILALFVRDHAGPATGPDPSRKAVSVRQAAGLLRIPGVRRLLAAACLLGLATVGDGFVYLLLQRREDLSLGWFPLLAVGTSLAYLLLAAPLGVLADRVGRLPVTLCGYGALILVYLALLGPVGGPVLVIGVLGLYGLFYAATDGILMALAAPLLPERLRTTGLALVQTGQAMAYLGSSVLFGVAWQLWGTGAAILLAVLAGGVAITATAVLLSGQDRRTSGTEEATA